MNHSQRFPTPLPLVKPPPLILLIRRTWTGRLILINSMIFIAVVLHSGSVLLPPYETLSLLGAKDPVSLVHGDYWRLVTPVFLHIGVIHFFLNNLALYIIGFQIESLLGAKWFLLLYFVSGIAGNIWSSLFQFELSAGASGAIFGLLGMGSVLEIYLQVKIRREGGVNRIRPGTYVQMVGLNLAIGFLLPMIDDAAHIGGLCMGLTLGILYLSFRKKILLPAPLTLSFQALIISAHIYLSLLVCSSNFMAKRLISYGESLEDPLDKLRIMTRAVLMQPDYLFQALISRAEILFTLDEYRLGLQDLQQAMRDPRAHELFPPMLTRLYALGKTDLVQSLEKLYADSSF